MVSATVWKSYRCCRNLTRRDSRQAGVDLLWLGMQRFESIGVNKKRVIPVILVLALGAGLYWIFRDRGVSRDDPATWDKIADFAAAMPVLQESDWKSREGFCSTEACKPVHQLF